MPRIISLLSLEVYLINLERFSFRRYCRDRSVVDKGDYSYSHNLLLVVKGNTWDRESGVMLLKLCSLSLFNRIPAISNGLVS